MFFPLVNDDLGVALCPELVALLAELASTRLVVVDLTVEGDPDGIVLIGHGLMPACEVNNL